MTPTAPPITIVVTFHPATGSTEVKFTAGGQALVANILLDVVAQLAERLVGKDPATPQAQVAIAQGVVKSLLNAANGVLQAELKPGVADIERIQLVGG